MDFSLENSKKRIEFGYNDCKNIYSLQIKMLSEDNLDSDEMRMASRINEMDDVQLLQETLRKIVENTSLVSKIQCNINLELKTTDSEIFWEVIAESDGWKFEKNDFLALIRLLDPMNNRKVWGSARKMYDICRNFLFAELKSESDIKSKYLYATVEERLTKLKSLFEKGLINESDFENTKKEILKEV